MARSGRARRRLNPLLCGCLSLGPPADVHIAPLLQECGAWETVPALVTIRMMTLLTRNDSTHSALLPTTPLICPPTYRFGCPRPCPRQCPQRARRDSRRGQQGGPVSGGPRVAPAGGEQSRAESLTLVGRCGGIIQACQYTYPTALHGFSFLGGLAGYLDVPRRPATCGVSKNMRERRQANRDYSNELFDI